jgi:Putative Flp pilus-assembly TadE/G-like
VKPPLPSNKRQRGAAAIIAGLSLALMLGIVALAVDTARMFVTRTEVQSAMDACALAAASQLTPGSPDPAGFPGYALNAAVAHGLSMSSASAVSAAGARPTVSVNRAYFQSRTISTISVQFSANLNGPFSSVGGGASSSTARFARCQTTLADVPLTFILLTNAIPGSGASIASTTSIGASAVASKSPGGPGNPTGSTTCGVAPVAVCQTNSTASFGLTPNTFIKAPCASGSCPPIGPGNFGWIDFSPPAGGSSELAASLAGQGQCGAIAIGQDVGSTGVASAVQDAWNSRFGLYKNGSGYDLNNAPPDYTGYAYSTATPVSGGVYRTNYALRRATGAVFNRAAAGFAVNNFNATTETTTTQHNRFGRSRRLLAAPIVDCSEFRGSSGLADIKGFACLFMLAPYPTSGPVGSFEQKVEYIGLLSDPNTPCTLSGLPGGGGTGGGGFAATAPYLVQ